MRRWRTWAQGAFLAGAVCLGAMAIRDPAWAVAGWLAVALLAWGMARWSASAAGVAGLVLGGCFAVWLALPWATGAFDVAGGPGWGSVAAVPATLVWAGLSRAPIALAWIFLGRRIPVWLWLPPAWILGEAWLESAVHLMIDAWLYGQWQVEPVLRALAAFGWWPTLAACLMLASALGAVAAGSRRALAPVALLFVAGLGLPALPAPPPDALEAVGAVHMAALGQAPRRASEGLTLLVWPEQVAAGQPRLSEGTASAGRPFGAPLMRPGLHHLIGAAVKTPGGPMNAIAALAPDGRVQAVRGKRMLFPLVERPFLGMMAPNRTPYAPGSAPARIAVGTRRVGALVCLESFDRGLFTQAREQGAQLIALSTNDELLGNHPIGHRQMLGMTVLRAVECGLPIARASLYGRASLVGADGKVLAWSAPGETGVLKL